LNVHEKKELKKITFKKIKSVLRKKWFHIRNFIFNILDVIIPKTKKIWIMPVYFLGEGDFSDNILAFYEAIKDNKSVKKIILTRKKNINPGGGINVKLINIFSLKAVWFLLRAKVFIVQHSLTYELMGCKFRPTIPRRRIIINLWHGITVKDLSHPEVGIMNKSLEKELPSHFIITSSEKDKIIMQKVFYPTKKENFWLTGLPRNDFLKTNEYNLPEVLKHELAIIKKLKNHKQFMIYTPTYKESQVGGYYYQFSADEINRLKHYLSENNYILGIRFHLYNSPDQILDKIIDGKLIVDVSAKIISNMSVLIREADIIITDYSSIYIDSMYLQKPLISFAYDYDHYMEKQHGLFYDFKTIFPGEICHTFDDLMKALSKYKNPLSEEELKKYNEMKKIFFKYNDANNTQRVVERVNNLV